MGIEIPVLGGEERVDDEWRHSAHRDENALFRRVFGQKPPVAGMDAGDGRRLVGGELLVIGQVAPEIPHGEARDGARGDPREDHQEKEKFDNFHGLRART